MKTLVKTAVAALLAASFTHQVLAADPVFVPLYENTPVKTAKADTLYTDQKGVFFENIVALPNGDHIFTSLFDGRLMRIDKNGNTQLFATVAGHTSGIESDGNGGVLVSGWAKDERRLVWQVSKDGVVSEWASLKEAALPNGITRLKPGIILIADSVKGLIWQVNEQDRSVSVWSADPLLGGFNPDIKPAIPAVNGLKRHGYFLYASNMSRNQLVRFPITANDQAGTAQVYVDKVFIDDFAVTAKGVIYATTHAYNSVIRIDANRKVTLIGQREQGLQGATALALQKTAKGNTLTVTTNGGVYVPPAWGIEQAKIVRLTVQ
jgi:sugar lactone lactonase YvrE